MAKPFHAKDEAARIYAASGLSVAVAVTIDDGEDGVFVQVGYGGLAVEDAEYVVGTMLRDLRRQIEDDFHDCDACRRRLARVTDAIGALERDGAKPTGQTRGETH